MLLYIAPLTVVNVVVVMLVATLAVMRVVVKLSVAMLVVRSIAVAVVANIRNLYATCVVWCA